MVITGSYIRDLRKKFGLSQDALAKLSNISQAHIAKIEGGKVDPRLSTFNSLLIALNLKKVLCEDVMTKNIIHIGSEKSLRDAAVLMREHNVSQLPVIERGVLLGLITEEDILRSEGDLVGNCMGPASPQVSPMTSVFDVKPLLDVFPCVIVLDKCKRVGIIARSDLLCLK